MKKITVSPDDFGLIKNFFPEISAPALMHTGEYIIDWNQLMSLVEHIKKGDYGKEAYGSVHFYISATGFKADWSCSILGTLTYQVPINKTQHTYTHMKIPHITVYDKNVIECTCKAIIQFIEWYKSTLTF